MFYTDRVRPEYRIEPCRSALNPVKGMGFSWSLNPYMGCVHRCTFCYVRHFEQRADRPSDDRYGRSIRVKTNVADILRRELARRSWQREEVALGTATDPYQPAEERREPGNREAWERVFALLGLSPQPDPWTLYADARNRAYLGLPPRDET